MHPNKTCLSDLPEHESHEQQRIQQSWKKNMVWGRRRFRTTGSYPSKNLRPGHTLEDGVKDSIRTEVSTSLDPPDSFMHLRPNYKTSLRSMRRRLNSRSDSGSSLQQPEHREYQESSQSSSAGTATEMLSLAIGSNASSAYQAAQKHEDDEDALEEPQQRPTPLLTERSVYDFVWSYCETYSETTAYAYLDPTRAENAGNDDWTLKKQAWNNFLRDYYTPDYMLVRSSGNPLDVSGLRTMFESGDCQNFSEQVVAVESIKLLGGSGGGGGCYGTNDRGGTTTNTADATAPLIPPVAAVVVFKSEQAYIYKGQREDDFATWTGVVVIHEGKLKLTNLQRSVGKKIDAIYN